MNPARRCWLCLGRPGAYPADHQGASARATEPARCLCEQRARANCLPREGRFGCRAHREPHRLATGVALLLVGRRGPGFRRPARTTLPPSAVGGIADGGRLAERVSSLAGTRSVLRVGNRTAWWSKSLRRSCAMSSCCTMANLSSVFPGMNDAGHRGSGAARDEPTSPGSGETQTPTTLRLR